MFKHAALQRVRISLPDVEKLFKEPEMDCNQLKKAILELEQKILASNKKEQKFTPPSTSSFAQQHQSTSTSSTSFKAKITIKRPVAKRYGKNIDQICSTSTGNRRSSSSSSSGLKKLRMKKKKNVVKKAKKNDSSFNSDTSFFHSFGGRRSSTPFLGKDVQLFICIHCPAGSHLKYTNEHDYRLHVLARHRIVTNDCEAIHEYIKKQRFIYIGNLNFYCEDCDKFFDNQQQNALERATEWVVHRLEVHGTEFKENCATIIEKIFASPTHHPYLTIKREKQEILSDNEDNTNDEDDVEWKVYKKRNDEDSSFNPSPKKNGKKRKKMVKKSYSSAGGSGGGGSSVKVKKEI
ncbi:unnamed protein product [Meloidogyne enterolobii]|uniref:Uncharacterized protein n=1 Tax=Meloidogyne enterolobii TaxID=390850 RepID=A0ACB1ABG8_MELEN